LTAPSNLLGEDATFPPEIMLTDPNFPSKGQKLYGSVYLPSGCLGYRCTEFIDDL
jgi:hypothetical protein